MIKGVTTVSPYIITGNSSMPYFTMSTPSAGMMRFNGNVSSVEVYDGSYWQAINLYQSIDLSPDANEILNWAKKKMQEDNERKHLAETKPAIAAALENLKRAEEQLEITIHLSKQHETTTS